MSEILVTGANGFAGRCLVASLRQAGHNVVGFTRADGDIASATLDFPGVEHVFHLAARTFVPDSWENPRGFYETNVMGTLNVLELCRRRKASLTLISSYVYGPPDHLPVREDHAVRAFNPYCQTKIMGEEMAAFYQSHRGVGLSIVRPFNLYGPGLDSRYLISMLVRQFLDPAAAEVVVADVRPKRDYLYIDDFVQLLMRIMATGARGIYNAGSGRSASVEDVGRAVRAAAGSDKPLRSRNEERPHEVMDLYADISKARAELQWEPWTSLDEGIGAMVRAHGSQPGK
jgi:nucleoside-diphosphate-sugar epimerase